MSTLEILIALSIFTVSITAVVMLAFGNQSAIIDTEINSTALSLAQEMLEGARAASRNDWDSVVSSSTVAGPFIQRVEVSDADDFLKSIISKVVWQSTGQTHTVELATLVEDVGSAAVQGACAASAGSDWLHPAIADMVDLGKTGQITDVDVKNGIAYVTANGDDALTDFFVVDVATSSPQVLWSLDTGPGLNAVQVAGNYAYVANGSYNAQLQIVDLTTHVVKEFKLPGSISSSGDAITLHYYRSKIYLGTATSNISEFHVIDVSDIYNIREVDTWEFGVIVNALYVSNGVAYVATADAEELKILDVHDPTHVSLIGGYDAGGLNNGESFARAGSRLYLGRAAGNDELYSLDINDIYNGAVARGNVGNSSVDGIVAMGDTLFLATKDTAKDFQVWRTTDDTSKLAYVSSLDLPDRATAVDCEGQTIYLTTATSTRGLLILTAP